jgi:riboflavin kinase/FMN adenylyltransferase
MIASVLTLGTFDGVHRGHQRILRQVVRRAKARRLRSVVLAFGMPPRLTQVRQPRESLLTTLPEKVDLFKQLGVDQTRVLAFNRRMASTLPEDFFRRTLLRRHQAAEMVVGPRVAFGKNRAGRLPLLRRLGKRYHVRIDVVPPVHVGETAVSSSHLRESLKQGHVEEARRLLGYPYSVLGRVIHGSHRGRRLGFPTANLHVDPLKILPPGVFWVKVLPGEGNIPLKAGSLRQGRDGLCNVGTRPTFYPRAHRLHCEVYLLGKTGRLYGRTFRVVFLRKIRSERRFSSAQALSQQIARDFREAKSWIRQAAERG